MHPKKAVYGRKEGRDVISHDQDNETSIRILRRMQSV